MVTHRVQVIALQDINVRLKKRMHIDIELIELDNVFHEDNPLTKLKKGQCRKLCRCSSIDDEILLASNPYAKAEGLKLDTRATA